MSTDLDQLFAEARSSTLPPSHVDLDRVVARGRRRRATARARDGATIALAGAVVVGGGAFALSGGALGARGPLQSGSGGGTGVSSAIPLASPANGTSVATPPAPDDSTSGDTVSDKGSENAPAALKAVTLADPAPGFGGRRFPDSVSLTSGVSNYAPDTYWTATFGVGSTDASGPQATVIVGDYPMPATTGTPTIYSSPGPITETPVVQGHQAYVTSDGDQTILYFRTSQFTVQVIGGGGATSAQLVMLAESLRNLG
jgi:hypothetical protein